MTIGPHGLRLAVAVAALSGAGVAVASSGSTLEGNTPLDIDDRPDLPDRVSIDQDSPFFFEQYPMIAVRINGRDSQQVVEYCVSEGWARLCQRDGRGKMKRDSKGKPVTVTVQGHILPRWRDQPAPDVAVVQRSSEIVSLLKPRGEKPAISREQARYLRQQAAKAAKQR